MYPAIVTVVIPFSLSQLSSEVSVKLPGRVFRQAGHVGVL
jgi:hypothetical protein